MASVPVLERQEIYGWFIATDTFLAGTGGGTFLISFILGLSNKYEPIARIGALSAPVLVLLGSFFLLADIGSRTRVYRLLANPLSWMSRGTLIMLAFIISSLAYSLPLFGPFEWSVSGVGRGIGIVATVLSVSVAIYPGFLFGIVKRVPFWGTAILPLLFVLSSLYCGIAILLLINLFFMTPLIAFVFQLGAVGIVLIFMQLLVLGSHLEIARHASVSGAQSVRLLRTPLFIGGVVIVGLLVPLGLLFYSVFVSDILTASIYAGVASVFSLTGGLLLRHSIITAGVYLPLR